MTKVAIIIPIYNVETYLRACLDSVLSQTEPDWLCLMVDDGSTDSSASIAGEYARRDPRFRLLSMPCNSGQSAARNLALDHICGDQCHWITFIDSDDTVHPRYLETMLAQAAMTGADIAMTGVTSKKFTLRIGSTPVVATATDTIARGLYQTGGITPSVYGKLYKAHLFRDIRFLEGIIYEDLELMPRLWEKASTISSRDDRLYRYTRRPDSSINTFSDKRLDVLRVTDLITQRYSAHPSLRRAALDRSLSAAFNIFLLLHRHGLGHTARADECWSRIRRLRRPSLMNPDVRVKNKIGIIASFLLGRSLFARLGFLM